MNSPRAIAFLIAHLLFGVLLLLRAAGFLQWMELAAYDNFVAAGVKEQPWDDRVTVIGISEADIHDWNWPLTDERLANALDRLLAAGPSMVGIDLYRDIPVPPGEEDLVSVFANHANIIGARKFPDADSRGVAAHPALAGGSQVGFVDLTTDPGGIVRRGLLFMDQDGEMSQSFALGLALGYLEPRGVVPEAGEEGFLKLGPVTMRPLELSDGGYARMDAGGYQFLLDYEGASAPARTYTLSELMSGVIPADHLKDRIVLVGVIAESVNDFFFTPLSFSGEEVHRVPGVVLHGLIVSQLLRMAQGESAPMRFWSDGWESLWIWFWCMAGTLAALILRRLPTFLALGALALVLIISAGYALFRLHVWIPVAPPVTGFVVVAGIVSAYLAAKEAAERAALMRLFSRHVSADVAEMIWRQREEILQDGRVKPQRQIATVLFTDLVGFTTISERMTPELLMGWLNDYMESMVGVVTRHRGIVDKFIGDSVMAVFGVPFRRQAEGEIAEDAAGAVSCAISMGEALKALNEKWSGEGLPAVRMRVGVFTGPLVAGSLGSADRADYTVIGDTVNIASRLESYDKDFNPGDSDCRILIGDSTAGCIGTRFAMSEVGEIALKGKSQPLKVFHVTHEITQAA